ncbi:MAG TPA: hypothetical protein VFD27_01050, partial [Chthoniobacteraceae bacterium]|nr:hypothetical protein [Chthoniobacteraceae bacterium]
MSRSISILPLLLALHSGLPFPARAQAPNLEAYRKHALTHEGDAARGKKLFDDEQKLLCAKCHS